MIVYRPELMLWQGALVANRALGVGEDGAISDASQEGAEIVHLPGKLLLPGLVNAHSHAFQRLIRGRTEYIVKGHASDDFWSWREQMYAAATRLGPDDLYVAARQAFVEMALGGVTTVGEFHYLHHAPDGSPYADRNELALQVIRAARDVGLRIVLLRVGYARSGHGVSENPRQRRFIERDVGTFLSNAEALEARFAQDTFVRVGLAPHSVRAVPRSWLEEIAKESRRPVHMHVAEQPAEIAACAAEHGKRPVELLESLGLLTERFTAVHAIHLAPSEITALRRSMVCACPSTERNLGDGILPADDLHQAGVALALGSDSQANIDLLDEARQLELHLRLLRGRRAVLDTGTGEPDGLARQLLTSATKNGARSVGLGTGELKVGDPADFFTVDLSHPSMVGADRRTVLAAAVFAAEKAAIRDVAVAGRLIVRDGLHPLAEESGRAFTKLASESW